MGKMDNKPSGLVHCFTCLKLDRCWFIDNNRPECPQHPNCHCVLEDLSYDEVLNKANFISEYSKFDPYLLIPKTNTHTARKNCFQNGDILFKMQNGYKLKLKDKDLKIMFQVIIY